MPDSSLTLGVLLLPNAPVDVLLERARRAEELGFAQLWLADHYVNPYAPEQDWFDAWMLLAALAQSTSRIRLGTLVSPLTLRPPALLARQAMTVDHLSHGRLELGLGAGGAPLDHAMTGVPAWSPRERSERLEEAVGIVRRLLDEGELHDPGGHYPIEGARLRPSSVQQPHPRLTVAALGPKAIGVAARHADVWNSYGVSGGRSMASRLSPGEAVECARQRTQLLDRQCQEAGRDPGEIARSLLTFFGVLDPVPAADELLAFAEPYLALGMRELVLYWPGDERGEEALAALAEGLG